MSARMPAVSLVAVPGRRKATLEAAREIERRGFAGLFNPSPLGGVAFTEAVAFATERVPFGTSVAPIYARTPEEYAQMAAFLHEVSGGRFVFGVGVSHVPALARMQITPGKPLTDMRNFVERVRAVERIGPLPPIVLATLRKRMIALAVEIGDGMVFANGSRSAMPDSLAGVPAVKRADEKFFIGNMIPICISDDLEAAKAVNRRTLTSYVQLPNYNNYWKAAGYVEEMEAVDRLVAAGRQSEIPSVMSDRWLADCTLFGTATQVRDGIEAWFDTGIKTPIVVPTSAAGNQLKAVEELFAAFA